MWYAHTMEEEMRIRKEMESGKKSTQVSSPEEKGRQVVQESRGRLGWVGGCVKDIQRGPTVVVSDVNAASTHPASTHQEPDTHTHTCTQAWPWVYEPTLPTVAPPPSPSIHPQPPENPRGTNLESVCGDGPGAKLAMLRACSRVFHRVTDAACLRSCRTKCIAHDNA